MSTAPRQRKLITSPFVRGLGFVQIGGGEDRPDAGRKSDKDVSPDEFNMLSIAGPTRLADLQATTFFDRLDSGSSGWTPVPSA